jgi:hypothetical protein
MPASTSSVMANGAARRHERGGRQDERRGGGAEGAEPQASPET